MPYSNLHPCEFQWAICMRVPLKGEFFKTAVAAKEGRRMHFCKDNWFNTCWFFFLRIQKTIFFSPWNIDFSFLFYNYGLHLKDLVCFLRGWAPEQTRVKRWVVTFLTLSAKDIHFVFVRNKVYKTIILENNWT